MFHFHEPSKNVVFSQFKSDSNVLIWVGIQRQKFSFVLNGILVHAVLITNSLSIGCNHSYTSRGSTLTRIPHGPQPFQTDYIFRLNISKPHSAHLPYPI